MCTQGVNDWQGDAVQLVRLGLGQGLGQGRGLGLDLGLL